jgi:hypothetical protein
MQSDEQIIYVKIYRHFNNSLELVQKYYNDNIQNYFNIKNTKDNSYNH